MGMVLCRSLSVVLSVVLTLLSVSSCSMPEQGAPVLTSLEDVPVEEDSGLISILQCRSEIGQYMQQAVDQYASVNGNVRFSVQTVGDASDYGVVLRSRLLSGERVDIFHIQSRRDALELSRNLSDLSGLDWIQDAVPGTLDAVTMENGVYGIPYSIEGVGLIVNADIFREANIYLGNRPTITSMEEVFAELQDQIDRGELKEKFPNLAAVTEFAAQDKSWLGSQMADVLLSGAFTDTTTAQAGEYLTFPTGENGQAFLRLMALYSDCTKWEQLNSVPQSQQVESGFAAERVAVILQNAEVYRRIVAANPELVDSIRMMPVPLGLSGERQAIYTGVPAYWCVNAGSSEQVQEASKRFLTWLYQSDSGTALYTGRFKAISPYRETARDTGLSVHNTILRHMEEGNTLPMLHREAPEGWGEEVFATGMQQFLARELGWEDFLQACMEEWHVARSGLEAPG